MTYHTSSWDGYGEITNGLVKEIFFNEIYAKYKVHLDLLIDFFKNKKSNDLVDVMYILVCDEKLTLWRQYWVILVGFYMVTIYGYIPFSREEFRDFFLQKITRIRNEVCNQIRKDIAVTCLSCFGLFVGLGYIAYKMLC